MTDITVSYTREDQVELIHTASPLLGELRLHDPKVPGGGRGNARQLLAASALSCYCSSLAGALDTRGLDASIAGTATVHMGSLDGQRGAPKRITGITLSVTVFLADAHAALFAEVEEVMRQGCLVTASLEAAFPVTCTLRRAVPPCLPGSEV